LFLHSTFFNVGFDEVEIYRMTKVLAESGEMLDFKFLKEKGVFISIQTFFGGVAGKRVIPCSCIYSYRGRWSCIIVPQTFYKSYYFCLLDFRNFGKQ
jgi:hypothetical protein